METNIGNGNEQPGDSDSDSGTDKKEKLAFTEKEFYTLEVIQLKLKILKLEAECENKERKVRVQSKRINDLEATLITINQNQLMAKAKTTEKALDEEREKIAKRLGLESLDRYFVDDQTYQLTHEDEIPALENKQKS